LTVFKRIKFDLLTGDALLSMLLGGWKYKPKRRAFAHFALNFNRSGMFLHDAVRNR
jgi:hypothetical protein